MSTTRALRQLDDARLKAIALPVDIDQLARRYASEVRREMRRLCRVSTRVADLARVFPGAMHALSTPEVALERRLEALELIAGGAPLKNVSQALGVPMWTRRLGPEAFSGPIPPLPDNETFARRIASRLPLSKGYGGPWLDIVSFAWRAADEDFAVWIASQPAALRCPEPIRLLAILAAYAWVSRRPDVPAYRLVGVRWRPEIAFDTALCSAKSWLNRLRLVTQLQPGVIEDAWLKEGRVKGYVFTPLVDADDLLAESRAMQNCADQYADRLATDRSRLFSVRKDDEPVATVEIGQHPREMGALAILQLKTRHNLPANVEVWQAAYAWLATQDGLRRLPPVGSPRRAIDGGVWRSLLAAYRQQKGGAPWLPADISAAGFDQLDRDMGEMARLSGVSSWLFT